MQAGCAQLRGMILISPGCFADQLWALPWIARVTSIFPLAQRFLQAHLLNQKSITHVCQGQEWIAGARSKLCSCRQRLDLSEV